MGKDTSTDGVNSGLHELFTPRKLESELMDCGRAEWAAGYVPRFLVVFGVEWRRVVDGRRRASSGVAWHKRAGTWKPFWCPSRDESAHRCTLFDRQQATSFFRSLVMKVNIVTVFGEQAGRGGTNTPNRELLVD